MFISIYGDILQQQKYFSGMMQGHGVDCQYIQINPGSWLHDDVIKWKHFPRYWPFVRRIHRSPVNSPHKGPWRGALMVFFYLRLNKRLCKQSWGWWFEMRLRPSWRHCNVVILVSLVSTVLNRKNILRISIVFCAFVDKQYQKAVLAANSGSYSYEYCDFYWLYRSCILVGNWMD